MPWWHDMMNDDITYENDQLEGLKTNLSWFNGKNQMKKEWGWMG